MKFHDYILIGLEEKSVRKLQPEILCVDLKLNGEAC